jgi:hypothetical protein
MYENRYRGRAYCWVAATMLLAMLSGCGGDDENKSASQAAPPAASPVPAPAPQPAPPPPPPTSKPGAATLEWTPPTTQTDGAVLADLAGYRIHYGKSTTLLDTTIEIRNPSISSYVIEGLKPGTYYFAVTAFSLRGLESERSNAGMKQIM